MRKVTMETAISIIELEQMVYDFKRDIDLNDGANAVNFFTEDCVVQMSSAKFEGHAGIKRYYAQRAESIRKNQNGGKRTTRHAILNLQISFQDTECATLNFLICTFAHEGNPPHAASTVPVTVSDARIECRRGKDGEWRMFRFHGDVVFFGTEAFAKAAISGQ